MPLRSPRPGESQNAYMSYCVPIEIDNGRPQKQAVAICLSTYRRKKGSKTQEGNMKEITVLLDDDEGTDPSWEDTLVKDYEETDSFDWDEKAQWTTAYINDLPNSAFLHVESGGKKDPQGKTVPRSLRHLPYRNADGSVDLPHLRNALSRLGQMDTGEASGDRWLTRNLRDKLIVKAQRILKEAQKAATKAADDLAGMSDSDFDEKAVEWEMIDWTDEWKEWAVR